MTPLKYRNYKDSKNPDLNIDDSDMEFDSLFEKE